MMHGLSIGRAQACGHLEMLWHFAARYAPAGDVGRFNDGMIATGAGWEGDPARFLEVLTACGWLDEHPDCRYYVHDWQEHADDAIQRQLARARRFFANGAPPSIKRLGKKEHDEAKAFYDSNLPPRAPVGAQRAPEVRPAQPSQSLALPSRAKPEPVTGAVEVEEVPVSEAEDREYAEAVWQGFLDVSGERVTRLMAPMEFELVRAWRRRQIPLRVVLQALEDTRGRGRTLNYYGPSVEEAESQRQRAFQS